MKTRPPMPDHPGVLRLDTTGQLIGGPMVGPHDNHMPVQATLARCLAMFARVGAN